MLSQSTNFSSSVEPKNSVASWQETAIGLNPEPDELSSLPHTLLLCNCLEAEPKGFIPPPLNSVLGKNLPPPILVTHFPKLHLNVSVTFPCCSKRPSSMLFLYGYIRCLSHPSHTPTPARSPRVDYPEFKSKHAYMCSTPLR